jgi:hypothetical protein
MTVNSQIVYSFIKKKYRLRSLRIVRATTERIEKMQRVHV